MGQKVGCHERVGLFFGSKHHVRQKATILSVEKRLDFVEHSFRIARVFVTALQHNVHNRLIELPVVS